MFVNITNHPVALWSDKQKDAAQKLSQGDVVDLPFPPIDPHAHEVEIEDLADEVFEEIEEMRRAKRASDEPFVVHVMGEQGFSFALITRLQDMNITAVHSTTERTTRGFRFGRFRRYTVHTLS